MPKINAADYGSGGERKPPLVPEVLGGAEVAVLTVEQVRTVTTSDGRKAALLEFREQPDYVFWLNKTGIQNIVERLGDDTDQWIGESIPLVKVRVNNPRLGRMVTKYQVADAEDWDEILSESRRRQRRSRGRKK